jgi:hypothetical protein
MAILFKTWDSRLSSIAQHKHSAKVLKKDQDYLGLPLGACGALVPTIATAILCQALDHPRNRDR